jgi:hypothetical protein
MIAEAVGGFKNYLFKESSFNSYGGIKGFELNRGLCL